MSPIAKRPLTEQERRLACWMLEHGRSSQLDIAEVTAWRCPCGCASIHFQVRGHKVAPPGVHILADFLFGKEGELYGAFIYESAGLLSGLEVYGLSGEAPKDLFAPEDLRPYGESVQDNRH